jgi:hypothetical protein
MKNLSKTVISLLLIIVFLVACGVLMTIGYAGMWLHTYNAFTAKELVAEVTLSEQRNDNVGPYVDVTYTPIKQQSAFSRLIAPSEEDGLEEPQRFKIYGDTVHIGGPIVKFEDGLILLNFETIYKVGQIYGRYNLDNELEINRTEEMRENMSFILNGGIDGNWKSINDNLTEDTFLGSIYRAFIDSTQIDAPGKFASNKEVTYNLYITNNGFLWEETGF